MNTFCKKTYLTLGILLMFSALLTAGGAKEITVEEAASDMTVLGETDTTVTFKEADGDIVELPKNPQRAIVCLNSILDVWYMSGGTSLARVKGSTNVPDEAKDIPQLGGRSALNVELMMELEPDLLIFSDAGAQNDVRELFEEEGVPGVAVTYDNYEDFRVILDLFTRLNGTRDIYENTVIPIEKQVQSVLDQTSGKEGPSICILFASTRYVKVETPNTIAGYLCQKLGAHNIYTDNTIEGATRVDLSLEYILEQDPDIIFVTTMGDIEKCRSRLEQDVKSSDIWEDLSAVKNDRFIYLDKSYSVYRPNRFYPEAFKIMAEFIYPDVEISLEIEG